MNILGISAFYHDSAAAVIRDGTILAAAQEERFSRMKHDARFPRHALKYCIDAAGLHGGGIDAVAFYDKPVAKFARILETYFSVAPRGLRSFMTAMPLWLREKLWIPMAVEKGLEDCGIRLPPDRMFFPEHHESHAASAFFPSPFRRAAVLTVDGVGEWACTTWGRGDGAKLELMAEQRFPHSLGLLYSAMTGFAGFRVNSGEYKLMGLAPYGEPVYVDTILRELIDLHDDGSFRLNMACFGFLDDLRMTNDRFAALFGGPARTPESPITRRETDLARSIQAVTEEVLLRTARHIHKVTGETKLCMAGGVALNCVANGRLLREGPFEDIWIQPAAGDAGGAPGAALAAWHLAMGKPREADGVHDAMQGAQLGPSFSDDEIARFLRDRGYPAERLDPDAWARRIAQFIADGRVVGLFQGRMEFGPRALGCRSILGDARSAGMQSLMNLKIKFRESFRPFAPACLEERMSDYFELDRPSPYMLLVANVRPERRIPVPSTRAGDLCAAINQARSDIPAVTHVDHSARVQTVSRGRNGRFYDIVKAFEALTGCGVIINTSFNVRGEPIVGSPEDAYRCFMRTEMDALVLESHILTKAGQPPWVGKAGECRDCALD